MKFSQKKIENIINKYNLCVSYSIENNKKIIKYNSDKIYPIHSVSKLFTNILLLLLLNENIINHIDLINPIQINKKDIKILSKNIKNRLKIVTLLDCIKHEAGFKNYLYNYYKEIEKSKKLNKSIPNPIEPEDFLKYANVTVFPKKEIGNRNYSNLGILLAALSIKTIYNKKNKTKLTYNQILNKYIIDVIQLKSFSIIPVNNAIYPYGMDDYTRFMNGSPSSGYWLSVLDLFYFGKWINKLWKTNIKFKNNILKYKLDIYWTNPVLIGHWGYLQTSSAVLQTYINKNQTVSILSNHYDDARFLMNKLLE